MKTISLVLLGGLLVALPVQAEEQAVPVPSGVSAAATTGTTSERLDVLRREKEELRRRQAAAARRLAILETDEKLAELHRAMSEARASGDDRKLGVLQKKMGRIQLDRQWVQESTSLEEQLDAAQASGDKANSQALEAKLKQAKEARELANVQLDLDEARVRVRELEARLAELTGRRGK
ncbi:MAG: hypothetical protein HYY25_11180 [Candidatus Wallbacteria bacterium]|nr:hypothetical protein [Candidatus Wallbacteria bacterium]